MLKTAHVENAVGLVSEKTDLQALRSRTGPVMAQSTPFDLDPLRLRGQARVWDMTE